MNYELIWHLIQALKEGKLVLSEIREFVCPKTYEKIVVATNATADSLGLGEW